MSHEQTNPAFAIRLFVIQPRTAPLQCSSWRSKMEDRQTLEQQGEIAYRRLREALEGSGATPQAKEALAALRASCDELKADAQEEAAGRRAAQAALAAERSLASTLLDTVGALVVVLDREGRIVRFNRMCEQTTGYTFEEVEGQCFWDFLLLPEEVGPVQAAFDDLRSGHFPNNFENTWVARDGSRRLIAWINTAIPGPGGSPEYIIGTGLDITERSQAERTLRVALEKYRVLFESFPLGITVSDGAGQILECNKAAERLLGIPQVEHTQRDIDGSEWQIIRPDGSPMPVEDYASVRALREKRLIENVEMGIVKEGGDVTWLNVTAAPIPLEGYGVAVTYGDISEQVRAKKERDRLLRQARQDRESIAGLAAILQREWDTLQTIMESTPAQLAYLDRDFNFIRVNSAYAQGFGHSQEELIGANYFDLFPNAENQAIFERVRASGQLAAFSARPFEFADQPERGVTYWDWTLVPVKEGYGQMSGLVLSLLDVTDQVASRRAVEELAARDEAILNSLSEGIITFDPEGNVLTINPAALRILGFRESEHSEQRFKETPNAFEMRDLNGAVVPVENSPQARLTRGETFGGYELHVRNLATGATWIGSFSGAPVRDADGNLAMGVLAVHDITVEKQAAAQRDAFLEELKARLAEKEVLMREIYHRVKNNVQALIYLMDMQADRVPDENTRQMIRELQERARAMALVHEKLYQSQNLARIDFGDYLYDLVDNLSHAFGADRPIVWRIDVEDVSLSVDTAIPCGLIVGELLTNALKYAFPPGGGQPVAARGETECVVSITSRAEGNQITLVVADNGVGLPAGVDWTTTETLGLQLINVLACHQLGGQVEVDRSAGTSFKITFVERMKKLTSRIYSEA
jgi:PAS domain S-box-containing protein